MNAMSKRKRAHEDITKAKTKVKKLDQQPEYAIANDPFDEIDSAPIFNLNDDCCFQIFDFLSRRDLTNFGVTCKWAHRVADEHYQRNYLAFERDAVADPKFKEFWMFIENVVIRNSRNMKPYRNIQLNSDAPIKQLRIFSDHLSMQKINCLKGILSKLEVIKLYGCSVYGEFYSKFLKFCTNLKQLHINCSGPRCKDAIFIRNENDWLLREYPTLEHLELSHPNPFKINELKQFFDRNPNVRSLGIDAALLLENKEQFRTMGKKLDSLIIYNKFIDEAKNQLYNLLNELHERGSYQRLHLVEKCLDDSSQISSLNALEKLQVYFIDSHSTLISVINLKELSLHSDYYNNLNFEDLAEKFVNLERLYVHGLCKNRILPFIRKSVKLTIIQLKNYSSNVVHELSTWNKEREKLPGAHKIIIHVPESTYLKTKWAMTTTEFPLVALHRSNSSQ